MHAGAERNACNIVVSTETLQATTTNPSQTLLPVYKLTSSLTPAPLQVLTSKTPQPFAQPFSADAQQISIRSRQPA